MTLKFIDGFDHYSTSELLAKWTASSGTVAISSGAGRNGTGALQAPSASSAAATVTKTLAAASAAFVIGFAFNPSALPTSAREILTLFDAGSVQVDVRLNPDATLSVTRAGTALTSGTSSLSLSLNAWAYIEFKVTIADSIAANSCKVNVNGVNWINVATGQDTKATANASANHLRLGPNGGFPGSTTWKYDDLYVCDQSGSVNNDFLGDVRVETLLPSGAGNSTQWTPSAGSNYQCVDENPPNGDTDYVSSSFATNVDTYAMGNLSTSPSSIKGVQTNLYARKDDAGAHSIAAVVRSGGTDYAGATTAVGDTYAFLSEIREADPATSAAWTAAGVNAMQCGQRQVS